MSEGNTPMAASLTAQDAYDSTELCDVSRAVRNIALVAAAVVMFQSFCKKGS